MVPIAKRCTSHRSWRWHCPDASLIAPDPDWIAYLALAPIAFLGAFIFGVTGFGSALVTIPLASFVVPLPFALAVFALVDWTNALRVGLRSRHDMVKPEWVRMAATMVIGTVLGTVLLFRLPRSGALLALGVFVFAYALYALAARGQMRIVSRGWAYVAGVCGGLTGTLFGAGGPPYAIYLSHRPVSKEGFRATLFACSVVSITLRVISYGIAGLLLSPGVLLAALVAVPAALLGLRLGSRAFDRIDRATLARTIALLLLAIGASLIVRGLRA